MNRRGLIEEPLSRSVIAAFFEVYNILGYGFLENIHMAAMERELVARGHKVGREVAVPIIYKGALLKTQRMDMIVDGTLIVETKSTQTLPPGAERQLLNYLRATNLEVGLLLHFGPEPRFYRRVSYKK